MFARFLRRAALAGGVLRSAALGAACLVAACSRQASLTAAAGGESAFAETYPARLEELRVGFDEMEAETRESFAGIQKAHERLKEVDAATLREVYARADATGRSSHYAEAANQREVVERFLAAEGGAVRRRVAGSVVSSLEDVSDQPEKASCQVENAGEIGSRAAGAAERAMKQRLGERLEAHSDVHRFIALHDDALGQRQVQAIENQAEAIAAASYTVNVRLESDRRELAGLLEQATAVRETLDRDRAEADGELSASGLSKSKKQAIERRLEATARALTKLDEQLPQANSALEGMEQRREKLAGEYRALLTELDRELAARSPDAKQTEPAASDGNRDSAGPAR